MRRRIPTPRSGGLILSYKCSAECAHCIYACSPTWRGDWISEETLRSVLNQLARWITPAPFGPETIGLSDGLHFTGGEPFLNFDLLCRAVELAEERGIPSTFVETNCFWCTDDRTTTEKLTELRKRGLKGIMISVNPFYLEYVPFERTERCVRIALEIFGRNVAVYQDEYYRRFKRLGIRDRVAIEEYIERESAHSFLYNVEFFLSGRAPYAIKTRFRDTLGRIFPRRPARLFFGEPCVPTFARNWHNHFDNDGNYVPGFCAGISYGDCRELDRLLAEGFETEERPVLSLLMDENIKGLYDLAVEYGWREDEEGYFSKCHLCIDLRKHLQRTERFPELVPAEFYRQVDR